MNKKVELYRIENQIMNDAFDRIVVETHLKQQKEGYRSFVFCGSEPGVGTTTICINLGIAMAEAGRKAILIDCDLRKKEDEKRLNIEVEYGLAEYLKEKKNIEEIVCKTNYEMLDYISAGGEVGSPVRLLCKPKMQELLERLGEMYEFVIIDVPSIHSAVDAKILAQKSDATIIVTEQGVASKKRLRESKRSLEECGANVLGVVLNQVEKAEYKYYMKYYDYFKKAKYKKGKGKS